jgi:hypothetical protein
MNRLIVGYSGPCGLAFVRFCDIRYVDGLSYTQLHLSLGHLHTGQARSCHVPASEQGGQRRRTEESHRPGLAVAPR